MLLEKFKPVLQAFLHDHIDLQVIAVYALQVYCYTLQFPKGEFLMRFGSSCLVKSVGFLLVLLLLPFSQVFSMDSDTFVSAFESIGARKY